MSDTTAGITSFGSLLVIVGATWVLRSYLGGRYVPAHRRACRQASFLLCLYLYRRQVVSYESSVLPNIPRIAHQPIHNTKFAIAFTSHNPLESNRFQEIEHHGKYVGATMDRSLDEILAEQDQVRLDVEHTAACSSPARAMWLTSPTIQRKNNNRSRGRGGQRRREPRNDFPRDGVRKVRYTDHSSLRKSKSQIELTRQ